MLEGQNIERLQSLGTKKQIFKSLTTKNEFHVKCKDVNNSLATKKKKKKKTKLQITPFKFVQNSI